MSTNTVTILVTFIAKPQQEEFVSLIDRAKTHTLKSKLDLVAHVFRGTRLASVPSDSFVFERRSKKHRSYVSLESESDFRDFLRSLNVKHTMKLTARCKDNVSVIPERAATAPMVCAETIEQVRKFINEVQKSEIYDILKSFSKVYTESMSLDGIFQVSGTNEAAQGSEAKDSRLENEHRSAEVVHKGVYCDRCNPRNDKSYITGLRYKCMICYDVDLCAKCFDLHESVGTHSAGHSMIAIEDSQAFHLFVKTLGLPNHSFADNYLSRPIPKSKETLSDLKKKEESAKLISERAEMYSQLEEMVDGDDGEKLEKLKLYIWKGQQMERDAERNTERDTERDSKRVDEVLSKSGSNTDAEHVFGIEAKKHQKKAESSEKADSIDGTSRVVVLQAEPLMIEVAVVPKGKSLSQILLINKSEETIDCNEMDLNVVNCFGMTVASVQIEKKQGIAPGRTSKFNVSVSTTHFKYPFKIVLSSARLAGECQLSLKNMSGQVALIPIDGPKTMDCPAVEGFLDDSKLEDASRQELCSSTSTSTPSFLTASVHSILLPSLPKEVSRAQTSENESTQTNTDVAMSEDETEVNDDYDVISLTDAEDLVSEYEMLEDISK